MRLVLQFNLKKIILLILFSITLTSCVEKQTQYFIFTTHDSQSDSWKYYETDLYNPSSIEEIKIIPCAGERLALPVWSPNGKYYGCSAFADQPLVIYDSQNRITVELGQGNLDAPLQWTILGWSPDSQYVSMLNEDSKEKSNYEFSIMKYDGTGFLQLNEQSNGTLNHGEWSPNGKFIAHQTYSSIWVASQLYIWDMENGKSSEVIPDKSVCITRIIDWSPNAERILFEAVTCKHPYEYGYVYYSVNIDGTDLKALTEQGYESVYWTPDGRSTIITSYGNIYLADVDGKNRKLILDDGYFVSWITP